MVPLPPFDVAAVVRTASSVILEWRCPRSCGSRITQYQVQRRRLKGKHDRGMPSDDEYDMLTATGGDPSQTRKSRRRMDGQMHEYFECDWQDVAVMDSDALIVPPPFNSVHPVRAELTADEMARRSRLLLPHVEVLDEEVQYGAETSEYCCDAPTQARIESVMVGSWVSEAERPSGMTSIKYRYFASDFLLPSATYEFRVRCSNSVGWGDWSTLSPPVKCLPSRPYRPGVPYVESGGDDPVILRWGHARHNGLPLQSYELSFCEVPADLAEQECVDPSASALESFEPEWKVQAVVPGRNPTLRTTMYQASMKQRLRGNVVWRKYRVRALNAQGWGMHSDVSYLVVLTRESCMNAK